MVHRSHLHIYLNLPKSVFNFQFHCQPPKRKILLPKYVKTLAYLEIWKESGVCVCVCDNIYCIFHYFVYFATVAQSVQLCQSSSLVGGSQGMLASCSHVITKPFSHCIIQPLYNVIQYYIQPLYNFIQCYTM